MEYGSIARELMRPYSTIRGWLVRMVRRGLGGRFDRKSDWKEEDPESTGAQEDNGVDAQGSLKVRVRAGIVASGPHVFDHPKAGLYAPSLAVLDHVVPQHVCGKRNELVFRCATNSLPLSFSLGHDRMA